MPSPAFLKRIGVQAVRETAKPTGIVATGPIWTPTESWSDVPAGAVLPEGAESWPRENGELWARVRSPEVTADLERISQEFNDRLFPPSAPVPPVTTNLTADELADRAPAQLARFRQAAKNWNIKSKEADVASEAAKALDARIANGIQWCEDQMAVVAEAKFEQRQYGGGQGQIVAADALYQEGRRQLETLRDERHRLGQNLDALEAEIEREAVAMADAEDAIKGALGSAGMCCPRCYGWVVDAVKHQEDCK